MIERSFITVIERLPFSHTLQVDFLLFGHPGAAAVYMACSLRQQRQKSENKEELEVLQRCEWYYQTSDQRHLFAEMVP